MKNIGLVTNFSKDPEGIKTKKIVDMAEDLGMGVNVSQETFKLIGAGIPRSQDHFFLSSDIIISLGGDGTLLKAACQAALNNKPILGINMGNLGFLTDGDFDDAANTLRSLKMGSYTVEKRMMLKATILGGGDSASSFYAFNDIGIMKALVSRIIHLKASVNNHEINSYFGDGLLVSSPTGSTAYSLSAGGPIIDPSLKCLLLTPICPHSLNARSIIINGKDAIEIEIMSHDLDITLTADGQGEMTLVYGDRILVEKADIYVNLLHTKKHNFFELIHEKITI